MNISGFDYNEEGQLLIGVGAEFHLGVGGHAFIGIDFNRFIKIFLEEE
jgi:hypothetical protein